MRGLIICQHVHENGEFCLDRVSLLELDEMMFQAPLRFTVCGVCGICGALEVELQLRVQRLPLNHKVIHPVGKEIAFHKILDYGFR